MNRNRMRWSKSLLILVGIALGITLAGCSTDYVNTESQRATPQELVGLPPMNQAEEVIKQYRPAGPLPVGASFGAHIRIIGYDYGSKCIMLLPEQGWQWKRKMGFFEHFGPLQVEPAP